MKARAPSIKNPQLIICDFCRKSFTARNWKARFCGPNCTQNDLNKRKREHGKLVSDSVPPISFEGDTFIGKYVTISIPYTSAVSKNRVPGYSSATKKTFYQRESRQIRESVGLLLKSEMNRTGITFVEDKIWISILVQKRFIGHIDAVNAVDLVCDAVKDVIGVDDKWFSIKLVDWEIKKTNPQITIEVGQADDIPKKVCTSCGRILNKTLFRPYPSNTDGLSRVCEECQYTDKYPEKNRPHVEIDIIEL
jgi:hypothetical protein